MLISWHRGWGREGGSLRGVQEAEGRNRKEPRQECSLQRHAFSELLSLTRQEAPPSPNKTFLEIWMRNVPHGLKYFRTWRPVAGTVLGSLGGMQPCWRKYVTVSGLWEFKAILHHQFTSCASCSQLKMWLLSFLLLQPHLPLAGIPDCHNGLSSP